MKHIHVWSERLHRKKDAKERALAQTQTTFKNNTNIPFASQSDIGQACSSEQAVTASPAAKSTTSTDLLKIGAPIQSASSVESVSTGPEPTTTKLWREAMDRAKKAEDWQKFSDLVDNQQKSSQISSQPLSSSPSSDPKGLLDVVEAVATQIQQQQTTFQLGSRTVVVRKICGQVISGLIAIKDVGNTIASTNPYATLAWSSLQFVLQLAATAKEVREMCWEVVPRVVYLISRYQTLEELYINDESVHKSRGMLEEALIELYTLILDYQVSMVVYISSRWERMKTSFGKASDSKLQTIWMQITSKEASLPGLQTLADREIGNEVFRQLRTSNTQLRDTLEQTWAEVQGISHVVNEQQRRDVLEWISEDKYETAHTENRRAALPDTGHWLLEHDCYSAWRSESDSGCFWLSGLMGSGKSCLSHVVIEDIAKDTDSASGQQLAYYYIDGSEARRRPDYATQILRCLLKQLTDLGPGQGLMKQVVEQFQALTNKGELRLEKTIELLRYITTGNRSTVLILDGLDECDKANQTQLIKSILLLYHSCDQTSSSVKVFFASRPLPVIERALSQFKPRIIKTAVHNLQDINTMIQARVQAALEDPYYQNLYKSIDHNQADEVVCVLRDKSQGMFRWVQSALEYLHSSIDYDELQERLERLHHLQDLFSLYDEIYETTIKTLAPRTLHGLRLVLTHLIYNTFYNTHLNRAAESPACAVERERLSTSGLSNTTLFLHYSVAHARGTVITSFPSEYIVSLCPNFIDVVKVKEDGKLEVGEDDESEAKENDDSKYYFQFPHFSVQEYLLDRYASFYSPIMAHTFLAKEYMNVFMDELTYNRTKKTGWFFFLYSAAGLLMEQLYLLRHSVGSWDEVTYDQDFADQLHMFLSTPPSDGFLRWHTCIGDWASYKCQTLLTNPPSTLFARIFLRLGWEDSNLSMENLNVKGRITTAAEEYRQSAVHFAALHCNPDAIRWLASMGVDLNHVDFDGRTVFYALLRASRYAGTFWSEEIEADTCRTLLECGARPRVPIDSGPYAFYRSRLYHAEEVTFLVSDLQFALRESCSVETVALLLENGMEEVESKGEWYMMALWECFGSVDYRNRHVDSGHNVMEHDRTHRDYLLSQADDYMSADCELGNVFSSPSRYIPDIYWNSVTPYSRRIFLETLAERIGRDYGEITRYESINEPLIYEAAEPAPLQSSVEGVDEDTRHQDEHDGPITSGEEGALPTAVIARHQTW